MYTNVPELILKVLEKNGNKAANEAARVVIANGKGIDELNHAASSDKKKLKNGAIKTLRIVSEKAPELTYSFIYYYDFLLDSPDQILQWNATFIIANHAPIDKENKIDKKIVNKFIDQLKDEVLITAANTASCLWKIAKYKPEFRSLITENLIKVDLTDRDDECKAIIAGKAILSLEEYWPLIEKKEEVMEFVNRHVKSQRSGTSKKAKKFIDRNQKDLL
jgi:hypothetical protein